MMPGFLASEGEEFTPGSLMRFNPSELWCKKKKKSIKEIEKDSDIDIRSGQEECPPARSVQRLRKV